MSDFAIEFELREQVDIVIGFTSVDDILRFPVLHNLSLCNEVLLRNCDLFWTWGHFPLVRITVVVTLAQG